MRRRHKAAIVIQRYIRRRNNSFRHSVRRLIQKEKWMKQRAANMIAVVFVAKVKRKRELKAKHRLEADAAVTIQNFVRRRYNFKFFSLEVF